MTFITRPDYSSNRQIKQFQFTNTILSGSTTFGVNDIYIPESFIGDTINIDALQFIRTRGLIIINGTQQNGYVLTSDANGKGTWLPSTGDNDYITGSTFNISTGDLTLTRLSGGTVIENLDGRYQLSGTTDLSGYIPYTGGTTNVNLGIYNITSTAFIISGGTSVQFLKGDGTLDTNTYSTITPTGLEAINEGNGVGWRLIGRNPANYDNIGLNAIDFSVKETWTNGGAIGELSFNMGADNRVGGWGSAVFGYQNTTSASLNYVFGDENTTTGYGNFIQGHKNTNSSLIESAVFGTTITNTSSGSITAGIGLLNKGNWGSAVFGAANTDFTGSASSRLGTDRIFIVGNGTFTTTNPWSASVRSDALIITRDGVITAPSLSIAEITAEATGKALVTREYLTSAISGITIYRVFIGLISQSGTNPPTIAILENTTELTVTTEYFALGKYKLLFTDPSGLLPLPLLPELKIFATIATDVGSIPNIYRNSDERIIIKSLDFSGTYLDDNLWERAFEVRIYN